MNDSNNDNGLGDVKTSDFESKGCVSDLDSGGGDSDNGGGVDIVAVDAKENGDAYCGDCNSKVDCDNDLDGVVNFSNFNGDVDNNGGVDIAKDAY